MGDGTRCTPSTSREYFGPGSSGRVGCGRRRPRSTTKKKIQKKYREKLSRFFAKAHTGQILTNEVLQTLLERVISLKPRWDDFSCWYIVILFFVFFFSFFCGDDEKS